MDELERAAQEHRDQVAAAHRRAAERTHNFVKTKWTRRRMALTGKWRVGAVCVVVAIFVLVTGDLQDGDPFGLLHGLVDGYIRSFNLLVSRAGFHPTPDQAHSSQVLVAYFLGIALLGLLLWGFGNVTALIRQSALRRWPNIDCEQYLVQLGEPWKDPVVHARMVFNEPWPTDTRQNAIDAARKWMPALGEAAWDGPTLDLATECIETEFFVAVPGGGWGSSLTRNNRLVHDATVKLLHRVVRKLARRAPVQSIQLEITGDYYTK